MAVDKFDFESELGEVMELDQQLAALRPTEPQLTPQPTPMMEGVIVVAAPAPPMTNGAAQPGGIANPASGGGHAIPAMGVAAAARSRSDVVPHFNIGDDDVHVRRARAPRVRPRRV